MTEILKMGRPSQSTFVEDNIHTVWSSRTVSSVKTDPVSDAAKTQVTFRRNTDYQPNFDAC
jgi:hypothetical protein